jgi:hypothetical protein
MTNNPDTVPSAEDRRLPRVAAVVSPVRWAWIAVVVHCGLIVVCGRCADLDARGVYLARWSPEGLVLGMGLWLALFAWLLCPIMVVVQTARRPRWTLVLACLAEGLLCCAQYQVLLPMCQ